MTSIHSGGGAVHTSVNTVVRQESLRLQAWYSTILKKCNGNKSSNSELTQLQEDQCSFGLALQLSNHSLWLQFVAAAVATVYPPPPPNVNPQLVPSQVFSLGFKTTGLVCIYGLEQTNRCFLVFSPP